MGNNCAREGTTTNVDAADARAKHTSADRRGAQPIRAAGDATAQQNHHGSYEAVNNKRRNRALDSFADDLDHTNKNAQVHAASQHRAIAKVNSVESSIIFSEAPRVAHLDLLSSPYASPTSPPINTGTKNSTTNNEEEKRINNRTLSPFQGAQPLPSKKTKEVDTLLGTVPREKTGMTPPTFTPQKTHNRIVGGLSSQHHLNHQSAEHHQFTANATESEPESVAFSLSQSSAPRQSSNLPFPDFSFISSSFPPQAAAAADIMTPADLSSSHQSNSCTKANDGRRSHTEPIVDHQKKQQQIAFFAEEASINDGRHCASPRRFFVDGVGAPPLKHVNALVSSTTSPSEFSSNNGLIIKDDLSTSLQQATPCLFPTQYCCSCGVVVTTLAITPEPLDLLPCCHTQRSGGVKKETIKRQGCDACPNLLHLCDNAASQNTNSENTNPTLPNEQLASLVPIETNSDDFTGKRGSDQLGPQPGVYMENTCLQRTHRQKSIFHFVGNCARMSEEPRQSRADFEEEARTQTIQHGYEYHQRTVAEKRRQSKNNDSYDLAPFDEGIAHLNESGGERSPKDPTIVVLVGGGGRKNKTKVKGVSSNNENTHMDSELVSYGGGCCCCTHGTLKCLEEGTQLRSRGTASLMQNSGSEYSGTMHAESQTLPEPTNCTTTLWPQRRRSGWQPPLTPPRHQDFGVFSRPHREAGFSPSQINQAHQLPQAIAVREPPYLSLLSTSSAPYPQCHPHSAHHSFGAAPHLYSCSTVTSSPRLASVDNNGSFISFAGASPKAGEAGSLFTPPNHRHLDSSARLSHSSSFATRARESRVGDVCPTIPDIDIDMLIQKMENNRSGRERRGSATSQEGDRSHREGPYETCARKVEGHASLPDNSRVDQPDESDRRTYSWTHSISRRNPSSHRLQQQSTPNVLGSELSSPSSIAHHHCVSPIGGHLPNTDPRIRGFLPSAVVEAAAEEERSAAPSPLSRSLLPTKLGSIVCTSTRIGMRTPTPLLCSMMTLQTNGENDTTISTTERNESRVMRNMCNEPIDGEVYESFAGRNAEETPIATCTTRDKRSPAIAKTTAWGGVPAATTTCIPLVHVCGRLGSVISHPAVSLSSHSRRLSPASASCRHAPQPGDKPAAAAEAKRTEQTVSYDENNKRRSIAGDEHNELQTANPSIVALFSVLEKGSNTMCGANGTEDKCTNTNNEDCVITGTGIHDSSRNGVRPAAQGNVSLSSQANVHVRDHRFLPFDTARNQDHREDTTSGALSPSTNHSCGRVETPGAAAFGGNTINSESGSLSLAHSTHLLCERLSSDASSRFCLGGPSFIDGGCQSGENMCGVGVGSVAGTGLGVVSVLAVGRESFLEQPTPAETSGVGLDASSPLLRCVQTTANVPFLPDRATCTPISKFCDEVNYSSSSSPSRPAPSLTVPFPQARMRVDESFLQLRLVRGTTASAGEEHPTLALPHSSSLSKVREKSAVKMNEELKRQPAEAIDNLVTPLSAMRNRSSVSAFHAPSSLPVSCKRGAENSNTSNNNNNINNNSFASAIIGNNNSSTTTNSSSKRLAFTEKKGTPTLGPRAVIFVPRDEDFLADPLFKDRVRSIEAFNRSKIEGAYHGLLGGFSSQPAKQNPSPSPFFVPISDSGCPRSSAHCSGALGAQKLGEDIVVGEQEGEEAVRGGNDFAAAFVRTDISEALRAMAERERRHTSKNAGKTEGEIEVIEEEYEEDEEEEISLVDAFISGRGSSVLRDREFKQKEKEKRKQSRPQQDNLDKMKEYPTSRGQKAKAEIPKTSADSIQNSASKSRNVEEAENISDQKRKETLTSSDCGLNRNMLAETEGQSSGLASLAAMLSGGIGFGLAAFGGPTQVCFPPEENERAEGAGNA